MSGIGPTPFGDIFHSLPRHFSSIGKPLEVSRRVVNIVSHSSHENGVSHNRQMTQVRGLRKLPAFHQTDQRVFHWPTKEATEANSEYVLDADVRGPPEAKGLA